MLKGKTVKISGADITTIGLRDIKGGRALPPKGAGLKKQSMLAFVGLSQNNIAMQCCYLSMLRKITGGMKDSNAKKGITKEIDLVSRLAMDQYQKLESIKKGLAGSAKDEY